MLVGVAIAMLVISWYAPNAGRALAVLTLISMLAVLYSSDPKPRRRRYRDTQSQLDPDAARAFIGISGVMFALATVAARRRRDRSPIAPAIVVRRQARP